MNSTYTVGLDFGTHQTKICIEDSTISNQKSYEFVSFKNLDDMEVLMIPSLVKINKDNTVSYGFFDDSDCSNIERPECKYVEEPKKGNIEKEPVKPSFNEREQNDLMKKVDKYKDLLNQEEERLKKEEKKLGKIDGNINEIDNEISEIETKISEIKTNIREIDNNISFYSQYRRRKYKIKVQDLSECRNELSQQLEILNRNKQIYDSYKSVKQKLEQYRSEYDEACKKYEIWEKNKSIDEKRYEKDLKKWYLSCEKIKKQYELNLKNWKSICKKNNEKYKKELEKWKKDICKKKPQIYRYFKQAIFIDPNIEGVEEWIHDIAPETISVWYIAYLLFVLRKRLKGDFFIQMGVPVGFEDRKEKEKKAYQILIAACKLVDSYNKDMNEFLKSTTETLKEHTKIEELDIEKIDNNEDINNYGLWVVPEAYAGLFSVTKQGQLPHGMNLLVDIGGGTTDISFFTIDDGQQPNIHKLSSMPYGLNYIFEQYIKQKGKQKGVKKSLADIQNMLTNKKIKLNVKTYHIKLISKIGEMIHEISLKSGNNRAFYRALRGRPIVYTGGGSMYEWMRTRVLFGEIQAFSDVKLLNRDSLSIENLKNQEKKDLVFPILATAYGLSIPMGEQAKLIPIAGLFPKKLPDHKDNGNTIDYGLSDNN